MSAYLRRLIWGVTTNPQGRNLAIGLGVASVPVWGLLAWKAQLSVHSMAGLGLWMLVFAAWLWVARGLLGQNHPRFARLVPGHHQGLRRQLWVMALPLASLWGLAFCLIDAEFRSTWLGLAWVLTVLVGWAMREIWLWFVYCLSLPLLIVGIRTLAGDWLSTAVLHSWASEIQSLAWALLGVLLLFGLCWAVGRGDAAHRRWWARFQRLEAASLEAQGARPGKHGSSWFVRWAVRIFTWPQALHHRLIAAGRGGSALTRAELTLWPGSANPWNHLVWVVYGLLFVWLIGDAGAVLGPVIVLGSVLSYAPRLRGLLRSRPEQGLIALLPGLPQGGVLARQLAWRGWAVALCAWALPAPVLLMMQQTHPNRAAAGLLAYWALGLLAVTSQLRDWGLDQPSAVVKDAWGIAMLSCGALGYAQPGLVIALLPWVLPVFVVLTVHRGRGLRLAQNPLPAGRRLETTAATQ